MPAHGAPVAARTSFPRNAEKIASGQTLSKMAAAHQVFCRRGFEMHATMTGLICTVLCVSVAQAELRVGAAVTNITPQEFPVIVNGGMLSNQATEVNTPLHARAIVVDDGGERLAIVVVDSCMIPRPLCDEAKQLAAQRTKIRPDRMLISATHTHTAPSCMGALGTNADLKYVPYLREKLAQSIVAAEKNLEPARVGWVVAKAAEYTALRRWIRRPDRVDLDPFGNPTVRANMHAASNWDNVIGPSGPEDPDLSMISFQAPDGRPIAVLANFSMHYFSDKPLSADYFGLFSEGLKQRIAQDKQGAHPPFVGIMSHGCSGDIWRRDYALPATERPNPTIASYTEGLLKIAVAAYQSIRYDETADIAMAEKRLRLAYRVPDKQRLTWAQSIVAEMGERLPKTTEEVYAREQVILHDLQSTEVVVQALRIGNIGIATTPSETYALTGIKLKKQSPLQHTMVIELANGGDGYIPPPEQHLLGGYNTWAARSAGLEVQAEPKITAAALQLLEQVSGQRRRVYQASRGPACKAILDADPVAYWRLDEFAGKRARDVTRHARDATFETGVAFFLDGPENGFCQGSEVNRAVHFAGGRLVARVPRVTDTYTVSLWFWNGMPNEGRETTGWMFSHDDHYSVGPRGVHLGLGGTATQPGKLLLQTGAGEATQVVALGTSDIARWTWNHVVLVRTPDKIRVYLNGAEKPEIQVDCQPRKGAFSEQFFFAGRSDQAAGWEGRLDEIAVFDRALSATEVQSLQPVD
ncbi:MAG: hypothetical protein CL681_10670 [Blastopirellula sp.]|nr:hypothetical protein [Blastopirellula sp.]MAR10423.1 hypothetical protein [Blastopirellula sp.]